MKNSNVVNQVEKLTVKEIKSLFSKKVKFAELEKKSSLTSWLDYFKSMNNAAFSEFLVNLRSLYGVALSQKELENLSPKDLGVFITEKQTDIINKRVEKITTAFPQLKGKYRGFTQPFVISLVAKYAKSKVVK